MYYSFNYYTKLLFQALSTYKTLLRKSYGFVELTSMGKKKYFNISKEYLVFLLITQIMICSNIFIELHSYTSFIILDINQGGQATNILNNV